MSSIDEIPTRKCRTFEDMPSKDILRVMFRKSFDVKVVASWYVWHLSGTACDAVSGMLLVGAFRTRDGASSPPGGLEGCCAEYDGDNMFPQWS